jgi:hypothetical protein
MSVSWRIAAWQASQNLSEQLLPCHDLAGVVDKAVEHLELAFLRSATLRPNRQTRGHVQGETSRLEHAAAPTGCAGGAPDEGGFLTIVQNCLKATQPGHDGTVMEASAPRVAR